MLVTDAAEKKQTTGAAGQSKQEAAASSQAKQKQFDTPDQAADALIQVAATSDAAGERKFWARTVRTLSARKIR